MRRRLLTLFAVAAMATTALPALATSEDAFPGRVRPVEACDWSTFDYHRDATHSGSTVLRDLLIPLRDGTTMAADVHLPGDGTGRFPVALTITGYGKNAQAWSNATLISHGYAHVVVDDIGTGASEGQWDAWGERAQAAYGEVVDWIAAQDWAHPSVGMIGASYMGLTQIFTAAQQPEALKAIFAHVPSGDAYRDIVFQGGQFNAAFIPAWMGLMAATSAPPSSTMFTDPAVGTRATIDRGANLATFKGTVTASGAVGGEAAYDGEFWEVRSPLNHLDRVEVPAFLLGGQDDLFQRSTPMHYEVLSQREAETKLIEGPWDHLGGSQGSGLAAAGLPPIEDIQLQWFDEHVGADYLDLPTDPAAVCEPDLTQYIRAADTTDEGYEVQTDGAWPRPDVVAETLHLTADGALVDGAVVDGGSFDMVQNQPSGACSRSAGQWTLGVVTPTPCGTDNSLNETGEITFTSAAVDEITDINGPIQADLYVSSTQRDAVVSVAVSIVDASGRSRGISNGLMSASFAHQDLMRSRMLPGADGTPVSIQPWFPFTKATHTPLLAGEIRHVPVEIFQVSARLQPGERIRVSIAPADQPHAASTLVDQLDQAGGITTLHVGAGHPASITLPVVGALELA